MIQVVLIKQGKKFKAEYVNRLAWDIKKALGLPHYRHLYTDDPEGVDTDLVNVHLLHQLTGGVPLEGWWNKMALFRKKGIKEKDRILWMDLDTVILGNLGFLFTRGQSEPFIMLRDFFYPDKHWNSSIMLIQGNAYSWIWEEFVRDTAFYRKCGGDQQAIEYMLRERKMEPAVAQDLWPGMIFSYKADCLEGVPSGARIVCFHGRPMPHEVGWDPRKRKAA